MRWRPWTVLALASVAVVTQAQTPPRGAPRTEITMVTGPETSTAFQMGRDVKRLLNEVVPETGIDLAIVPSQGSIQNVIDVFRYSSVQLGITQNDVLSYLDIYARGDPEANRIVGGLQVVGHLYSEDVYLFARPGINGLADLAGKRVDIGPPGRGTTVTALVLMHLAGVEPREIVNIVETANTVTALRNGRIDAFFRVVATPSEYLREGISASHGFVLVPIRVKPKPEEAALAQHYAPSVIPAGAYPWLDHPVETVKIGTTIVTAGVQTGSPACEAIARLVQVVVQNGAWLRQNGHPEWKDIDHSTPEVLNDPRVSPCAAQGFRR
jgi:uncharacterized protein